MKDNTFYNHITQTLKRYLIAGLLIWVPITVTLFVLRFVMNILGAFFDYFPQSYQPQGSWSWSIPILGIVSAFLIMIVTGFLGTNFIGRRLVRFGEAIVNRIPLVNTVYNGAKQIMETFFAPENQGFKKVFLVEYPRKGLWSVSFQTGECDRKIESQLQKNMITIFIPTTPNPTSGFLMMIEREDAIALDITVEQALKFVISLGVVQPSVEQAKQAFK
jgi:uncharacterized membrane protein